MTTPGGMDRNVQVTLKADVDPFQRGMAIANKSVVTLSNSVVVLAKKIDELWKAAGRKLEMFGAGGIASLVAATEAANRLDVAFRGVRSTAALTGQSVNQLKEGAAGLARALPASNTAIAQLMGQVQDLGVKGTASIVKFTEVAVRLGAATNTQPGALFSDLLQLTRAMGSNIQDIDRYSSSLVELSKQNGVASQQILGFANAIEAVAQRAGYTQTQVLGLSTAFAKAGADSGAGATAFIKITNDISEAVRTGSSVLDQYATIAGKTTKEFRATAQSNPAAAFIEVINAIKDAGPRGISILQSLGMDAARTQRAIAALTSGQANLAQAMDQSSDAYAKNQALNKASNAAFNDLSSAMTKFRTAIAQITEAMGGPFLGVATKMVEAVTWVINLFNRMPDSVKTALAIFAALASTVTLLGGAFLVVSLAVLKFGMVWRVLSGAMGSNIFKGLVDGLRGTPRALDDTSAAMTRLYNATYRVTNATQGNRMAGETGLVGNLMGRQGGNILGFPARKFRAEVREVSDTLKHPIDYRKRSEDAWSPYGLPGIGVAVKKKVQSSETLTNARDALFGTPEESLNKAQAANQRLRAIAEERQKVFDDAYRKMKQTLRTDPQGFDDLASQFFQAHGKNIDSDSLTPKHRVQFMQNAAQAEANIAAQKMKDSFKDKDGDEALNPFKSLALKIKSLSSEMVGDITTGTGKIMDAVEVAFAASVAKIIELSAKAKAALLEIKNGAVGLATAAAANTAAGMGNAGNEAGSIISSSVTTLAARAGKTVGIDGFTQPENAGERVKDPRSPAELARGGPRIGPRTKEDDQEYEWRNKIREYMTANPDYLTNPNAPPMPMWEGQEEAEAGYRKVRKTAATTANLAPIVSRLEPAAAPSLASDVPRGSGESLASQILGGLGSLGAQSANNRVVTLNANAAIDADKANGAADAAETLEDGAGGFKDKMSDMASGLGEQMQGLGGKLATAGEMLGKIAGPAALLAPVVLAGVSAFHKWMAASDKAVDGLGSLGQQFKDFKLPSIYDKGDHSAPTAKTPTEYDRLKAFSTSGTFLNEDKNNNAIARFDLVKGDAGKRALAAYQAQQLKESAARQNRVLTADEKDTYSATMMNVFGAKTGYQIAQQNLNSGSNPLLNTLGVLSAAQGQDSKGARVLLGPEGLGLGTTQPDANNRLSYAALSLLGAQAQNPNYVRDNPDPGINNSNLNKATDFAGVVTGMNEAYQRSAKEAAPGKANAYFGQTPQSFVDAYLNSPSEKAQRFGKELQKVFDDIGYTGDNAAEALTRLNATMANAATTADTLSPLALFQQTRYSQAMGANFDYSNLQTNEAQLGLAAGGNKLGGGAAYGTASFYGNQLSALLEARGTQAVQGDPNRLALINQQVAAARSGVAQQRGMTMSGVEQMGAMSQDIMNMSAGGNAKYNIADIQDESQQLASLQNSQLDQLKSFVLQVKQMNRQRVYEEEDHTLQLSHMYRDRKLQQEEAMHSYNESIRSSMYETATAFGNPGAFVQSTYTQSATSALTGASNQLDYLKRSKAAMDSLGTMGLSKDAIRLMGLDDPKNFQQAERFVHDMAANPKLISQWNTSIKGRLDISKGIATDVNNSKFAEMKRSFDYTATQATKMFQQSINDFETAYKTAQQREKDAVTNLAKDAMTGMGDIVQAAKDTGIQAVKDYANSIVGESRIATEAINTALGAAKPGSQGHNAPGTTHGGGGQDASGKGAATKGLGAGINAMSPTSAPSTKYGNVANQKLGQQMAKQYGWNYGAQWDYLQRLWGQESGWNDKAGSKGAAYGIPQGFTSVHPDYAAVMNKGPAAQIAWGLDYIKKAYGNPQGAVAHKDATDTRLGVTHKPGVDNNQPGGWYAKGGIISGRQVIGVGENGPEMVLPLNGQGTSFIAAVVAQSMQRMGVTTSAMRGMRTAGYAGPTQATSYHHVDASQNFTGPITVEAQDPNEMARKLADKKRLAALTRPPGGRG